MAMTRAAARAAVAAWFAPPNVLGLNRVYPSFPKLIPTNIYFAGTVPGTRSGAIGIVHIVNKHEVRHAMGGAHSGVKRVDYEVELQILMLSSRKVAELATDDLDAVVDAVETRLRADRTLGSPNVWQAGEKQVDVDYIEPRLTEQWIENWCAVRFELTQFLMGT